MLTDQLMCSLFNDSETVWGVSKWSES